MRNKRYKDFTKQWLIDNGVEVFIDGVDTTHIPTDQLSDNYKTFEIYQYKRSGYMKCKETPNSQPHPKGLIKTTTYMQVNIGHWEGKKWKSAGIPLHRVVFVWFNDIVKAYDDNGRKMDICHKDHKWYNNHIKNLKWDTHKNNLAERDGYINQWGFKKNDRA